MRYRLRNAVMFAVLIAAIGLAAHSAFSQQPEEGSLLSSPHTGGAKLLPISSETMLSQYSDLASGYERRRLAYIVQDENKVIKGKSEFSFGFIMENGVARTELLKTYEYPFPGRSRLVVDAENLLPVKYTLEFFEHVEDMSTETAKPAETWTAEYYYDMVAVRQDAGDTGTFTSFRRPMKSLDFDELYLLMSRLDTTKLPEKSAVLVTAPFQHRNHAALLENLGGEMVFAADAEQHACTHLRLTFIDFVEDYYVERREPNRVIKFNVGGLMFTLQEDLTNPEPIVPKDESPAREPSSKSFLLGGKE
jgi:hypothetical protein